ncbi:MAG TPA: ATP synthase F0 subunit B [Candidatus Limnocylindria bacterium]|nr:ATP synthase F0 subunit B [Candidatus Limnocylindria bacterium]
MIVLDYSVVYQIILFVVLWLILSKVLFRPYLDLLEERERKTTGAQHDSEDLEHEGTQLKVEYEEKIAQAQAAGYAAKEAIVQDARRQREKILGQAREEAAASLNGLRQEVAAALEKEQQLAAAEVSIVAADMVSKVLGRKVA